MTPQLQRLLELGTGTVSFDAAQRSALQELANELGDDEQPIALLVADSVVDGTRVPGIAVLTDRRLMFAGAVRGHGVFHDVALTSIDDLVMASRFGIGTLTIGSRDAPVIELCGATSAVTATFLHSLRTAIDWFRGPAVLVGTGAGFITPVARRTGSWFAPAAAAFVVLLVGSIAIAQIDPMDDHFEAATITTSADDAAPEPSDALVIVVTTTGAAPPVSATSVDDSVPKQTSADSTIPNIPAEPSTSTVPSATLPSATPSTSVVVSSPTTTEAVSVAPPTAPSTATPAHNPASTTAIPSTVGPEPASIPNTTTPPVTTVPAPATTASQPVAPSSTDVSTTAAPSTAVPVPATMATPPATSQPGACSGAITAVNPSTVGNVDGNGPTHADVSVSISWSGPCEDLHIGFDPRNSPGSSFRWVKTRGSTSVTIVFAGGESWVDGPHTIILAEGRGVQPLDDGSLIVE